MSSVPMGLENLGLARQYDAWLSASDARDRAEERMAEDFLALAAKCDAGAVASWAPQVNDYSSRPVCKRQPTLGECMFDAMDYPGAPSFMELMQFILDVAAGADRKERVNEMLRQLAAKFADAAVVPE